jgi:hypothetical protein
MHNGLYEKAAAVRSGVDMKNYFDLYPDGKQKEDYGIRQFEP